MPPIRIDGVPRHPDVAKPSQPLPAAEAVERRAPGVPRSTRRNRGKPRGVRFSLRLPPPLRASVARFAQVNGMSVNDAIVALLAVTLSTKGTP